MASKKQWIVSLARFHRYTQENKADRFATPWSQWSEDHVDFLPNVDHLVIIRN